MDIKDLVRRVYELFNEGKFAEAGEFFAPDAVWNYPGQNAFTGEHKGREAIVNDLLRGPVQLVTAFRVTLMDVLVGDRHNAAFQWTEAERDGQSFQTVIVHVFIVKDGLIRAVHSYPYDARGFDAFWAAKAEEPLPQERGWVPTSEQAPSRTLWRPAI